MEPGQTSIQGYRTRTKHTDQSGTECTPLAFTAHVNTATRRGAPKRLTEEQKVASINDVVQIRRDQVVKLSNEVARLGSALRGGLLRDLRRRAVAALGRRALAGLGRGALADGRVRLRVAARAGLGRRGDGHRVRRRRRARCGRRAAARLCLDADLERLVEDELGDDRFGLD